MLSHAVFRPETRALTPSFQAALVAVARAQDHNRVNSKLLLTERAAVDEHAGHHAPRHSERQAWAPLTQAGQQAGRR